MDRRTANVGGVVLSEGMENIRNLEASFLVDDAFRPVVDFDFDLDAEHEFGSDFDVEFDALVAAWAAERDELRDEYSEAEDCLESLLEARSVMASMQAQEQRCLARLEAIALQSVAPESAECSESAVGLAAAGGPSVHGGSREIAWRSMAAEIAVATRLSDRTVQSMMGRASALVHKLPVVLESLEGGRISMGHARVILEHAPGIESDALVEYQRITVGRAETTTPGKLAGVARITAARLRAESFEERHVTARSERKITIRDLDDGMSELTHLLPTVFAAAVFDRLTRQAKAVAATGDPRSRDQLRSDLATDLLLTGEPSSGADTPHTAAEGIRAEVAITIPALTLLGQSDEPATLLGRGPIDLDTACRLASIAPELVRVFTDPVTGMVINADTYRPTASLRRYLEQRDRHCQFPTCNRDARYTDIDHTVPWEQGGRTVPGNLACMCRGHHTLKHHGGWKVKQTSPGVLEWTSPLGRTITNDALDAIPPGSRLGPRFEAQASPEPPTGIDDSPAPF